MIGGTEKLRNNC